MLDAIVRHLLDRWIYVLVKVDTEFVTPYTPPMRERIHKYGGYDDQFAPFLENFLTILGSREWQPGTYYPAGWYRAQSAAGVDQQQLQVTPAALAHYYQEEFRVEADGAWRVGEKLVEGNVQAFFLKNLEFDPEIERYRVRYWLESYYETRYLHHLSPPLRVRQITAGENGVDMVLNDGGCEPLRAATLRMDQHERLYCGVKSEGLPALFENNARWQLLQLVEEQGSGWVLCTAQGEIPLHLDAPLEYPGGLSGGGLAPGS